VCVCVCVTREYPTFAFLTVCVLLHDFFFFFRNATWTTQYVNDRTDQNVGDESRNGYFTEQDPMLMMQERNESTKAEDNADDEDEVSLF
jgi:hypothetical protein